jgi:hypothetical protein
MSIPHDAGEAREIPCEAGPAALDQQIVADA